MRMNVKLLSFIFMLTIVPLEGQINFMENFELFLSGMVSYAFPKDPNIVRVRKPEDIKTGNNVAILDFIGLIEQYGYSAEEHYVTTEDGYNLVIHRISGSPLFKGQQRRKVVFLQHGLMTTSDTWVMFGPGRDLAFLLIDQGYDVWLGNIRGNSYSRSHIKMSPRDKDFWQFSYHEMGTKDLPAMIDYILNYTKQKSLRYIGFSMGTTIFFILLSIRPEYNAKIELGICLAPVAMWKEISPPCQFFQSQRHNIKEFFDVNAIYDIFPLSSTSITLGKTLCTDEAITQTVCVTIMFLIGGSDPAQLNTTILPKFLSYFPAGLSVQTLQHYSQNIMTEKFQAFDYGYLGNYKQYGQMTPITYDLKKVTAPLALFYGANDLLAPKTNVLETYKYLPNVILLEEIPHKLFTHFDFIVATDVKTLLYDHVIELLQKFRNRT